MHACSRTLAAAGSLQQQTDKAWTPWTGCLPAPMHLCAHVWRPHHAAWGMHHGRAPVLHWPTPFPSPSTQIVRALSEVLGAKLPYDTLDGVRARLAQVAPHFAHVSAVQVSARACIHSACSAMHAADELGTASSNMPHGPLVINQSILHSLKCPNPSVSPAVIPCRAPAALLLSVEAFALRKCLRLWHACMFAVQSLLPHPRSRCGARPHSLSLPCVRAVARVAERRVHQGAGRLRLRQALVRAAGHHHRQLLHDGRHQPRQPDHGQVRAVARRGAGGGQDLKRRRLARSACCGVLWRSSVVSYAAQRRRRRRRVCGGAACMPSLGLSMHGL